MSEVNSVRICRCLPRTSLRLSLLAMLLSAGPWPLDAAELPWPNRSGPTNDGRAAAEDARDLPLEWDEFTGRSIAWKIALPDVGHSTPVIGLGRLWLTAATEDGREQYVVCVDAADGRIVHRRLLFRNADPEPLGNPINTYASPSCVLESDAVYVHFGSYGTARLDPATAQPVWERRDIPCRHFRGPGSSPVLAGSLLVLTFDGIDQQFLIALDKTTGRTVWRTDRSTDFKDLEDNGLPRGEGDFRKAYGTPGVVEVAGRLQIVSIGARAAFGYDAETGRETWTVEHDDYNAAAAPLFMPGWAFLNTGSRSANLLALRLDETTQGNVTASHIAWDRSRGNSQLAMPLLVDGRIYMVTDNGVLHGLDARTGSELFAVRLPGTYVASPVLAGERIYLPNEQGQTTVVRVGETPEVLATNSLDEGLRASPAIARGAIYLRTFGHLYKLTSLGR